MSLPVLAARARDSWVVLHLSQLRKLTSLSLSLCLAFANGRRESRHTERDKCARVCEDFIGIVSGPNGLYKLSLDFWVGLGLGMTL